MCVRERIVRVREGGIVRVREERRLYVRDGECIY